MLTAINSALNPIVYMFRSKEFRIAFKKLFRGTSIVRQPIEGKKKAWSRLEVSTCNQHGRQPSFPTVPTVDVRDLSFHLLGSSEIAVEVTEANLP